MLVLTSEDHFCVKLVTRKGLIYMALFICNAIRAVHLQLVSDLSSQVFIAALRRFVSRRGCPKRIFSDNGKNSLERKQS